MVNLENPLPDHIGEYRIDGRLGVGGMGEVYRAWDATLERSVAIKLIRADQTESAIARERFLREGRAIAKLTHPAIVQVHHIQKWEDHHCIVMELVDGENLYSLSKTGSIEFQRVISILSQIAEGLSAAHAQGIIHRDLKAANVMVTPGGRVKILDFGLAKGPGETISAPGAVIGTVHTMSPEQASGDPVDTRTDLFSLGVLAYELLTGQSPFYANTPRETLAKVISHYPRSVRDLQPQVPEELSDLVDRLLEKDPDHRPASAEDVSTLLQGRESTLGPGPWDGTRAPTAVDGALLGNNLAAQVSTLVQERGPEPEEPISEVAPGNPERRWRVAPLAICVLALALVIVYRAFWLPKPVSTVAVVGFSAQEAMENEAWISVALEEIVRAELKSHPRIRVIDGGRMAQIRRFSTRGESALAPLALEDLTKTLPPGFADTLVTGSWTIEGEHLTIDVLVRRSASGKPYTLQISGSAEELFGISLEVATGISEELGLGRVPEPGASYAAALPQSPEALSAYAEALMAWRSGDSAMAREKFKEALRGAPDNALLHSSYGTFLHKEGYSNEVVDAFETALRLVDGLPEASQLELMAVAHFYLHHNAEALDLYGQLFAKFPDELEYGLWWSELQADSGQSLEGLARLETIRSSETNGASLGLIDIFRARIRLNYRGEAQEALDLAKGAIDLGRDSGAHYVEAWANYTAALAESQLGNHDQASEACRRALDLYGRLGDSIGVMNSLLQNAIILSNQGNRRGAREAFDKYHEFFDSRENKILMAIGSVNLGYVLVDQGEHGFAIEVLEEAVEIFESKGLEQRRAEALNNPAGVFQVTGRLSEAQQLYEKVLDIFRALGDRSRTAIALTNLGESLHWSGKLSSAEASYEEALQIDRELGLKDGIAYDLVQLGEIAILKGDFDKAEERLDESLKIAEEIEAQDAIARSHLALARLEIERNNAEKAVEWAQQALGIFQELGMLDQLTRAQILEGRARLLKIVPDLKVVEDLEAEVVLRLVDSEDYRLQLESRVLTALFDARRGEDLQGIRELIDDLAEDAESKGYLIDAWVARLGLGEAEFHFGDRAAGRTRLEGVLSEAEERGWFLLAQRASRSLENAG